MTITIDGTSGIASVDGSAGSPSVRGSDSNSGIVYAADTVSISTGGTERLEVDSAGKIDIPDNGQLRFGSGNDFKFHHDGSGSYIENDTGVISSWSAGNHEFKSSNGNTRALFKNSDACELYYNNTKRIETSNTGITITGELNTNSSKINKVFSSYYVHRLGSSSGVAKNEAEAIYYGGDIHIFHDNVVCSSANFTSGFTANRSYPTILVHQDGSGAAIHAEDGAITEASDYRIKENITTLGSAIDKIKTLKPITYTLKSSWKANQKGEVYHGFVAHEVSESLSGIRGIVCGEKDAMAPELYSQQDEIDGKIPSGKQVGDETGNMTTDMLIQGVDYGKLTPVLTAALKEAIAKIETLEAKVAALEAA